MKKVLILIFCALILLLPGCSSLSSTAAPIAEPMGIVVSFPYDPNDPNHDYHADGYYLWEEAEKWTDTEWDAYLAEHPEDYELSLQIRYGIEPEPHYGSALPPGSTRPTDIETDEVVVPTQGTMQNCD